MRVSFTNEWVTLAEFRVKHSSLSDQEVVNRPFESTAVTVDREAPVGVVQAQGRAQGVRWLVESQPVADKEFQEAVIAMMYFGYLRRDYDEDGFQYWLRRLKANPQDLNAIAGGFVYSREYREQRF